MPRQKPISRKTIAELAQLIFGTTKARGEGAWQGQMAALMGISTRQIHRYMTDPTTYPLTRIRKEQLRKIGQLVDPEEYGEINP